MKTNDKQTLKFTKTALEALQPTADRQTIYDEVTTGLAVRISPSGHKSFYFYYRPGKGRNSPSKKIQLGVFPDMTPEQARLKARQLAAQVINGLDPSKELQNAKTAQTVAEVIQSFFEQHVDAKLKNASRRLYKGLLNNHILPNLGKTKIEEVSHKDVARLHHALRESPYMANRTAAVLSKFFNWCELHGYRDRHTNPAEGLEKFKEHKRMEFMKSTDLEAIGQALSSLEATGKISPFPAAALRLLLLTGARLEEILSLKWSYLDLEAALANLPDSKTGFKVLHLPAPAVEILRNLPRFDSEYIFASDESKSGHLSSLRRTWSAVCERANLKGSWRIHDLRHAFASAAVNSGASLPMIGALLGHSQTSTTARYAHLANNPVHDLAEKTGGQIAEGWNKAPADNGIIPFRPRQVGGE